MVFAWCVADEPIPIIRKEQKVVGEEKTKDYKFVIETGKNNLIDYLFLYIYFLLIDFFLS